MERISSFLAQSLFSISCQDVMKIVAQNVSSVKPKRQSVNQIVHLFNKRFNLNIKFDLIAVFLKKNYLIDFELIIFV